MDVDNSLRSPRPVKTRTEPSTPLQNITRSHDERLAHYSLPISVSKPPSRGRSRINDIHLPPHELPNIIATLNQSASKSNSRPRSRSRSKSRFKPRSPSPAGESRISTPIRARRRRSSDHYITRSVRRRRSSIINNTNNKPVFDPTYVGEITVDYLRSLCRASIEEKRKIEQPREADNIPQNIAYKTIDAHGTFGVASEPESIRRQSEEGSSTRQTKREVNFLDHERKSSRFPEEFDHSLPLPSNDVLGSPVANLENDDQTTPRLVEDIDDKDNSDSSPRNKLEEPAIRPPNEPLLSSMSRSKKPGFKSYLERILEGQRKKRGRDGRVTSETSVELDKTQVFRDSPENQISVSDLIINDQTTSMTNMLIDSAEDLKSLPGASMEATREDTTKTGIPTWAMPSASDTIRQSESSDQDKEAHKLHGERSGSSAVGGEADSQDEEAVEKSSPEVFSDTNDMQEAYSSRPPERNEMEMSAPVNNLELMFSPSTAGIHMNQDEPSHKSTPESSHRDEQVSTWSGTQYSPSMIVTPQHNVFGFSHNDTDGERTSPSRLIEEQYTLDKDDLDEGFSGGLLEELGNFTNEPFGVEISNAQEEANNERGPASAPRANRARATYETSLSGIPISMVRGLARTISMMPLLKTNNESGSKKRKRSENLTSTAQKQIKDMSDDFLQVLVSDLEAYAEHRKSKHIGLRDVILFFNRMKKLDGESTTEIENISKLAQNVLPLELLISLDNSLAESSGIELPRKRPSDGSLSQRENSIQKNKNTRAETGTRHLHGFSDSENETPEID